MVTQYRLYLPIRHNDKAQTINREMNSQSSLDNGSDQLRETVSNLLVHGPHLLRCFQFFKNMKVSSRAPHHSPEGSMIDIDEHGWSKTLNSRNEVEIVVTIGTQSWQRRRLIGGDDPDFLSSVILAILLPRQVTYFLRWGKFKIP